MAVVSGFADFLPFEVRRLQAQQGPINYSQQRCAEGDMVAWGRVHAPCEVK